MKCCIQIITKEWFFFFDKLKIADWIVNLARLHEDIMQIKWAFRSLLFLAVDFFALGEIFGLFLRHAKKIPDI